MDSEFTIYLPTKIGHLVIEVQLPAQKISFLSIREKTPVMDSSKRLISGSSDKQTKIILQQLKNYFSSAISLKTIPITPKGTFFQKSVWNELRKIPLGETRTYGDIAKKLSSSPRAVGNACRKNPIPIIVPCHRVISAKGIGGYAGEVEGRQINIKRWLLNHEGVLL